MASKDINRSSIDKWKLDSAESVDFYNQWFLDYAPRTFKEARAKARAEVEKAFALLENMDVISSRVLEASPRLLSVLRQMTCPPLARDRIAGLSGVSRTVVKRAEENGQWENNDGRNCAGRLFHVVVKLLDAELFPWLTQGVKSVCDKAKERGILIVADRLSGVMSDPMIRNEQERRQLRAIAAFLERRGYRLAHPASHVDLAPGEFAYHLNVKVHRDDVAKTKVNMPIDVAIQPKSARKGDLPLLIEAKSAGDFANVNKRRKEEAQKISQLRRTYGDVRFLLFLCGYFDSGYLGYEAAEGIDWIWEHRVSDMEKLGL